MSGHCPVCGTPGCNGSCNEMRGLSVREQAKRINEEAIELIEGVMQKHTTAMLEAMKEKVAEQREKARALACELVASQAREAKLRETLEESKDFFDREVGSSHLFRRLTIKDIEEALSQPTDDTALREMIQKAGEVMRESVVEQCVARGLMSRYGAFVKEIRAMPCVTLDDLNGGV